MQIVQYPLLPFMGFVALHFLVVVLFFVVVQRPLFMWYNRCVNDAGIHFQDIREIYRHGLLSDLKIASYTTAVPVLLLWINAHVPLFSVGHWIAVYDFIIAFVLVLISVADIALYRSWQFKIEASVLHYLRSLKGAFASVSATYLVVAMLVLAVVYALLAGTLLTVNSAVDFRAPAGYALPWWGHVLVVLLNLVIAAVFFILIRGLKRRPETPVDSFFSRNQFFNHSAVNPVYNFLYSLSVKSNYGSQFQEFDPAWCAEKFAPLFPTSGTPQVQLLNTDRPNILIVIWESLCARFIESLGGKPGVMPEFDRVAEEGVYFTNCYAASFRTDRGLVAILSGILGQPTTSVILNTTKLPHLTALPRRLRDELGYETTTVHGGQLNIFHKSDYYWASGHDTLVQQADFPSDAPANSWGVHDGYVFDWLASDIIKKAEQGKRWLTTFQTLSSHEPFTVPYDRLKDIPVDNSFAYVDAAFGAFVDRLKQTLAWKDLLIVVTGDHGVNLESIGDRANNPHIPLLLLGGAVKQPMTISTLVNQTDIAATLLGQMGLSHDEFIFSRDVTADTYTYPFAFHTYNNGFVFRDATGMTHYDNTSQQALEGDDPKRIETAKVILQTLYSYLDKQ